MAHVKGKIIAVDFDGTLCVNKWPDIGEPNWEVINYIKEQQEQGAKLILWTCRSDEELQDALLWCSNTCDLYFDAVNKNLPYIIKQFGKDTRKIFANEYIDDRMCTKFELPFRGTKDVERRHF